MHHRLRIQRFSLGQLQTNAYLLWHDTDCLIVDPVDDAAFLLEEIQRQKGRLVGMVATHGHFDHIMAVGEIQMSYAVPLYLHRKDQFLAKRLNETARYFLGYDPVVLPPKEYADLFPGPLTIESFSFEVLHTPGHTPGGCCLYFPEDEGMFVGDTIFASGVGRTDFSYADESQLNDSINTILSYPEETVLYPGHGEETSILAQKVLHGV